MGFCELVQLMEGIVMSEWIKETELIFEQFMNYQFRKLSKNELMAQIEEIVKKIRRDQYDLTIEIARGSCTNALDNLQRSDNNS